MNKPSRIYIDNQEIPLHAFKECVDPADVAHEVEYLRFSGASPLAKATFPHRHNFYEILYVTEGVGTHFIDFNAYPIKRNTFFFISPGQVHYWNTTVPLKGEILVFTNDFLLLAPADYMVVQDFSFFHTVEGSSSLRLNDNDHLEMMLLYEAIAKEFKVDDSRRSSALRAYIHILLVHIQRIYEIQETKDENKKDSIAQKLTRQFKQLVSKRSSIAHSVEEYAMQLGISGKHLHRTVKATTGNTPGQLIRQEIVLEAKRLCQHTNLTATEIGLRLGFDDASYFGRFFKREVGLTPGQFKKAS
ncbi:MAG: helix-turn-helix transcriptional regulator [Chloroflexota bacterium]